MVKAKVGRRALFVDLNNSARFPALAIGYLVAILRRAEFEVEVLSPLSEGVPGFSRDLPETWREQVLRRIYFSTHPLMALLHDTLRRVYKAKAAAPHPRLVAGLHEAINRSRPDVILISAYLDHRLSVEAVGKVAASAGIPVLLGGPVFNHPKIAAAWNGIPGVRRIFGGEADEQIAHICDDLIATGDSDRAGVFDEGRTLVAPRLASLDDLPKPDFSDFPWDLYPSRVMTVMTGRGCEWGRCTFCSDVVTANGRGFRTRRVDDVFEELQMLSGLYGTRNTFFLDIKLNSDLIMWRGLLERYQSVLPGGKWIGTVHVAARGDNGLDREHLMAAKAAGMCRISFGLESGSDRLNRKMGKGTTIERNIQFLEDAQAANLSVRTSMMLGYPGETVDDVELTVTFLRQYQGLLDRVRMSRFKVIPGTRFERLHDRFPDRYRDMENFEWRYGEGRADYSYRPATGRGYRRAKAKVLRLVHEINRKPLLEDAAIFNGLM